MLALANKLTLSTQPIYRFVNKYSIDFDGVDDCIVTDGADTVAQPTTYSFWSKSSTSGTNTVFGHGEYRQGAFHFNWNLNRPLLFLENDYFRYWDDNSAQDDGEWHHWVVYVDINDITNSKLYCDSVLQNPSLTFSSGSATAYTESLTIGGDQAVGGNYFEGQIDEFAVYDRELTQAEITRMYNTYYSPNRIANGNFSQEGVEEVTNGDFSQEGSEEVTNGDFATDSDWTKGTGWTIASGVASSDGSVSGNSYLINSSSTAIVGKTYKVEFTISNYIQGNVRVRAGQYASDFVTANGNYTQYMIAVSTETCRVQAQSNFIGSIDNVSVKEVGQDWTFGSTWSMGDGVANFEGSGTGSTTALYQNNISLPSGKTYNIKFDISNATGNASIWIGNFLGSVNYFGTSYVNRPNGSYDLYFTMPSSQTSLSFFANQSGSNFTIDNISVKEVGQHWTLTNGWSVDDTKATNDGTGGQIYPTSNNWTSGATIKFQITVSDRTTGHIRIQNPSSTIYYQNNINTNNTFEYSFTTIDADGWRIEAVSGFDGSIDNIVVQELKHDATNLMINHSEYQSANPLITSTKSMEFDGTDDYLNAGVLPDVFRNAFTVSAWIWTDTNSSNHQIFSTGQGAFAQIYIVGGTGLRLVIQGGSGYSGTIANYFSSDYINKWIYFTITWDSANVKVYRNAIEVGSQSLTGTLDSITNEANIGRHVTNVEYWNGKITEFGLYDRGLTALEVASLYNQGMPTNLLVNRNNYQSGNPTVFNTKQVDFDGTDDHLKANSTLGSMTGSLSMWFKKNTDAGGQYFIDFRGSGSGTGYIVAFSQPFISVSSGTLYINGVVGNSPSTGVWNHLVVTGITLNIDECINIGRRYSNTEFFDGDMSQVGLWNTTLTAYEVSSLYNHGLPIDLTTNQAAYESSSNLVGYWRMGSGTLDSYPLIADQTNATLGSELVTNGDFATDSDWTKQTGWSIANGKASYDGSGTGHKYIFQSITTTSGKLYKINFDVLSSTGSNLNIVDLGSVRVNQTHLSVGNYTYYALADASSENLVFYANGTDTYSIDNVTVKEVGGNPAIMTNQTSSDIENGSPYANIVQNGTFDTDSDWSKGTGWSIGGGVAISDGSSSYSFLQQTSSVLNGKTYKISYSVTSYTSGSVEVGVGGTSNNNIQRNSVGDFVEYHTSNGTNLTIISRNLIGSIDNVTVKEVNTGLQGYWKMGDGTNDEYPVIYDQTNPTLGSELVTNGNFATDSGWTIGTGWSISGGKANATDAAFNSQLSDSTNLVAGKVYKISFDVSNYVKGNVRVTVGNVSSSTVSSDGSYTFYLTTLLTTPFRFSTYAGGSGTTLSVDNVSVKEVQGNPATMTNMVEGNITNQYPLTKIRNYYRMGDGILDGYPIIQDQTSPNLAHIPTTNSFEYSEDFSQWAATNLNLTSGQTSPDNNTNAYKIIPTTTPGLHTLKKFSVTGQTFSVTAKKGEYKNLLIWSDASSKGLGVNLDDNSIFRNVSILHYNITELTDGWKRIDVTLDASYTGTFAFYVYDNSATPQITFAGNGTDGLFIYAAQLEQQSQATAYIKSDGIAAVRKSSTTNLIPYSEDFSQWTASNMADVTTQRVLASDITSPDGTIGTSYKLTASQVSSRIQISQQTLSQTYTKSIFVKYAGANTTIRLDGSDSNDRITFDVASSGVTLNTASSNVISHNIEIFSNDWYKVSVVLPSGNDYFQVLPDSANGNSYVYFWGGQLEEQTQAETYAKTTGLPVTIDLFTENNYGTMTNMSASDIIEDTPNN